jgi:hypothetical protein
VSTVCLLLRQDPAFRVLPRAVITALGLGLLFRIEPDLAHGLATLNADNLPGGFGPMYLVMMGLVVTFVLSANAWTRASRMSVSLPLPTRLTWSVRTASLAAVVVGANLATVLVLGLSVGPNGAAVNPVIALAALRATVTAVLLVLLYQLPLADRDRIPITAEYIIYVIFVSVIVVPFSAAGITSIAGTMFLGAVVVGLGAWLWIRTPRAWSVGPSVAEAIEPVWSSRDPQDDAKSTRPQVREAFEPQIRPALFAHLMVFRCLTNSLPRWIILIGIGGAMAVVSLEFFDGTNAFLALALMTLWHGAVLQMTLERMTPFDPLPISRRALWAHTFGPVVVAVVIGALIAQIVYRVNPTRWSQIHSGDGVLEVPWEYLEITSDGGAPTVATPWGESATPKATPLWKGRPAALYNPYEVTPASSARFVEFQKRRAVAAVYGPGVTPANSAVTGSAGRSRSAAVAVMLLTPLMVLMMVPALFQYSSSVHRKIFKWTLWGGLIFFGVVAVALAVARLSGYTQVWYVGALASLGIRRLAEWLPLPTNVLWGLSVTFWLGAYLLLGSLFKRIELPGRNTVNRFAEEY